MENINIGVLDYCILAVYVCMMLGVGFYFKASAKMADYAVADKKLGLSVLIGTFLATGIGGGVLTGSTGNGYAAGIMELPKLIALFGINIFLGLFMAGKMRKIGGFTAPQMLGKRLTQTLCKPAVWCRIEAAHRRITIWPERIAPRKKMRVGKRSVSCCR